MANNTLHNSRRQHYFYFTATENIPHNAGTQERVTRETDSATPDCYILS